MEVLLVMWLLDALEKYKNSEEVAVIHSDEKTSFRELWNKSECIAGFLQKNGGVTQGKVPVVIYGNKETDILAVMHGALKTGVPYVPVDTSYPVERLEKIMNQIGPCVLVDFTGSMSAADDVTIVNSDTLSEIYNDYQNFQSDRSHWVKDDDVCYILFTSGSTGEPKGVPIRKRNIVNFVEWARTFAVKRNKSGNIAMNQVSYSFDVSVFALYLFLSEGYTIFSFDKNTLGDMRLLLEQMAKSHISVWVSTPAFAEMCCIDDNFKQSMLPELERFIVAGEVLTKRLVKEMWNRFPGLTVINGYGPTECTVLLTACEITEKMVQAEDSLPIGKILSDGNIKLLNPKVIDGQEVGELSVVSKSVGGEYFRNPAKTKERFYYDESQQQYGYKTGDLVYLKGNLLYYIGRMDSQIKLNGYRIELDDISENLNKLDYVANSVVLPVKEEGAVKYLVAFIKLSKDTGLSKLKLLITIKKDLGKLVPSYMIPKKIVIVDDFPLNVNGKIDRKKLMEGI